MQGDASVIRPLSSEGKLGKIPRREATSRRVKLFRVLICVFNRILMRYFHLSSGTLSMRFIVLVRISIYLQTQQRMLSYYLSMDSGHLRNFVSG